jgi:hypothetical protein
VDEDLDGLKVVVYTGKGSCESLVGCVENQLAPNLAFVEIIAVVFMLLSTGKEYMRRP